MGVEDEIKSLVEKGYTPKSLIQQGYSRSTVYKVLNNTKTFVTKIKSPDWVIEGVKFDRERHLPGESLSITFDLSNLSDRKLYLMNVGVRAGWMIDTGGNSYWYSQKVDDILNPTERKTISLIIPIPTNIKLGTYELVFGFQGQYLPVIGYQDQFLSPRWSIPIEIEIKYPFNGEDIFLSHSILDNYLVRNLKENLENYGFKVTLGEDVDQPGILLEHKFRDLIEHSTLFIALLTEPAIRSEWVNKEVAYAMHLGKPSILLKEKSLKINLDYQWNIFDRNATSEQLLATIMKAIRAVKDNRVLLNPETIKILSIALLSFLMGLLLARR